MSLVGPEGRKQLKLAARFASVGIELVVAIVVGFFGGRWLDVTYQTTPVLQYLGLALGIFAGFRSLFALARDAQGASEETDDAEDPDEPNATDDPSQNDSDEHDSSRNP